jgi:Lar family restriction alleviation protein
MSEELKPCPFCGSSKISFSSHQIGIAVGCDSCGAVSEIQGSKEQCAEAWNRRAKPAEAEGAVEMGSDAWMALHLLDRLDVSADEEPRVQQVEEIVRRMGAALSAVTAERDRLQQFEAAYNEWHDKTEWVQKTAEAHDLGKHRADVLKERVDKIQAEVDGLREAESLLLSVCDDLMRHENADVRMVTCIELNNWLTKRAAMAAKEA